MAGGGRRGGKEPRGTNPGGSGGAERGNASLGPGAARRFALGLGKLCMPTNTRQGCRAVSRL